MALEDATDAQLPYGLGSVSLTDPVALVTLAISLIAGMTLWNMADSIGSNFAARINGLLGGILGTNPATGQDQGGDVV